MMESDSEDDNSHTEPEEDCLPILWEVPMTNMMIRRTPRMTMTYSIIVQQL